VRDGKRQPVRIRERTLDHAASHRIRTVEHHDGDLRLRRLFQDVSERRDVRVEAGADVLDVEDDGV